MMMKNGIFLCSIGLLVFVYSANMSTGKYDFSSMATAISLIAAGLFFYFRGKKKEKSKDDQTNGEVKK